MNRVPTWQGAAFGAVAPFAAPSPAAPADDGSGDASFTITGLTNALKQVTPTLLLVGIATGAAFAVGSALASYVITHKAHGPLRARARDARRRRR